MNHLSTEKLLKEGTLADVTTYQAGVLQASTHRILQKQCDLILKQYGITKMQWLIIGSALDSGAKGIRLTDLSKTLDTTISYITVSVNLLVSMGILSRTDSATDSRSKLVTVNKAFEDKCEEIEATLREGLRISLYADISPEDLATYIKVMFQISNLDKQNR